MYDFLSTISDNSIIIIPNNLREKAIKFIRNNNIKLNIKFFSIEEFISNLTFSYDEKTIYNLMKMNNLSYSISKLYLDNIKYVYNDSNNFKLNNLFNIKNNIKDDLIYDTLFLKLISNKNIYIYGYDYINKYYKYILSGVNNINYINKTYNNYKHDVYKFSTLEDEIIFVCEKINELLDSGISINNIYICNLDNNYYQVINSIFNIYNIPININNNNNLYQTSIGKYFINNLSNNINDLLDSIKNKYDLNNRRNNNIYKKLISVINEFYFTNDYISIRDNIINKMKSISIDNIKYKNAVNEINIIDNIIDDNDYVFLVGFNQYSIPKVIKDEDYINDNIKFDYMEKSYEMNIINKNIWLNSICSVKNLFISYKEKYLNEVFYPSLLIIENNMNVIDYNIKFSKYCNNINCLILCKYLDNLVKYNVYNESLDILYNTYNINYKLYDNKYNNIDKNNLYNYLNNKLSLSFSSMNTYYICSFRYYLDNILNINKFEDTIQTYIGNLYHYILSKCFDKDFIFDNCVNEYISNNKLDDSFKSMFFINKSINHLRDVIKIIKYQNTLGNMNDAMYEKNIVVNKKSILDVKFSGYIDKILLNNKNAVIIDYKTYDIDIKLEYIPYGLSLQLPVYLYLTKNLDKDIKIIGIYLQQVLSGLVNKDNKKTLKEINKDNLKLKGFSIGDEYLISMFDSTYQDSELIKGLKMTKDGFSKSANLLTYKQIDNIINITDNKINECISGIENSKFDINPKSINGKNISCTYCKYKDICFKTNKDIVEFDIEDDLDFLN